jgi:hypothetical protein
LTQFAERYVDALANRQPHRVPLAPTVRFTENGAELAIGDALWATADALGDNRLIFTDPVSGGIHLYASVVEAGLPSMLAARLKVEDRQITEIETSVLRQPADSPAMSNFAVDDEDNQVASAIVTFDHRGNLDAVPFGNPNNTVPAGQFSRPFSFLIFESFKVIDGKIRQVEATVFQVPYKMSPGWPAD